MPSYFPCHSLLDCTLTLQVYSINTSDTDKHEKGFSSGDAHILSFMYPQYIEAEVPYPL